ncbi:MAG: glycosyltransferase family 9 protein [bacterium]
MGANLWRRTKGWLFAQAAEFARRPAIAPGDLLALHPRAVILVRQHNQMGDMVCATPAFRALRAAFPEARITLVTAPVNVGVVRHNPHIDAVELFAQAMWRRPWRLAALVRRLRRERAEVAFVLASVSFSLTSAWLALATGARYVVGADSRPYGWDVSRRAFSLEMPAGPRLDRHSVEHSLAPLQAIGITTDDLSTVVVPAPAEREQAAGILADLGLRPGFWAVHPGAGKRQNLWPADRFAEVVGRAAAAGSRILVLHGPADGPALASLLAELGGGGGQAVRVAPPCSVGTAAALLELADRFLCNDTGVMHVAGALGVPTVALFGPTDPLLWKPLSPAVVALRGRAGRDDPRGAEYGWMESLSVDEVWAAWSGLTGRPGPPRTREGA